MTGLQHLCRSIVWVQWVEGVVHRVLTSRIGASDMTSFLSSGTATGHVSSFPFLTPGEFDQACRDFCDRSHAWQVTDPGAWLSIHIVHQPTVRPVPCFVYLEIHRKTETFVRIAVNWFITGLLVK